MDADALVAHAHGIRSLARSLLGPDGDDAVQDAVVAALENPPANPGPWLAGVQDGEREVMLTLRRGGLVTGIVLDPDGNPFPQAHFRVFSDDKPFDQGTGTPFSRHQVFTDFSGRFRVLTPPHGQVDLVLSGSFNLPADRAEKMPPFAGTLVGVPAGSKNVVLRAERVAYDRTVTAHVVDPDGKSVAGAQVYAYFRRKIVANVLTNADGRAVLGGLPATTTTLWARVLPDHPRHADWAKAWVVVHVPEGQEVRLQIEEGVTVSGVVLARDGKPARGAYVGIGPQEGMITQGRTDDEGRFTFLLKTKQAKDLRIAVSWSEPDGRVWQAAVDDYNPRDGALTLQLQPPGK